MSKFVFVYGTLKEGYGANHKLQGQKIGVAESVDKFVVIGQGFPLAFLSSSGHRLRGELYEVPDTSIPVLDAYEGHPNFYRREEREFQVGDEEFTAWMYIIPGDPAEYQSRNELKPGEDGVLEWHRT